MAYEVRDKIEERVINLFPYGSVVYGTYREGISDEDFIYVVEGDTEFDYNLSGLVNKHIIVYSEALFIKHIKEHKVPVLECIFQRDTKYLEHFELDTEKLRRAFSSVASNSWCKAKKKMKEGDIYIAKKSLFHSLRILEYGIQIAMFGRIINYRHLTSLYDTIMGMEHTQWESYQFIFQPTYNTLKSRFKEVAPLDKERQKA